MLLFFFCYLSLNVKCGANCFSQSTPLLGNVDLEFELHVNDLLGVWEIQDTFVATPGEESFRLLEPAGVLCDQSVWVCAVCPEHLLILEHLLHGFDACDALEPHASIVMHFELDAQSAPNTLHDCEDLLIGVPIRVPRIEVHLDFATRGPWALIVEFHRHIDKFDYRWSCYICHILC